MSRREGHLWLSTEADRGKWRDAERARQNRREIQRALSSGEVSRRDLMKWGLFTTAGLIAPIGGLSPFVRTASAQTFATGATGTGVPTGLPASPTFGVAPFSSPLYRFDILPQFDVPGSAAAQHPVPSIPRSFTALSPTPTAQANQTQQQLDPKLVGGKTGLTGPIEGRPPGPIWAHQQFSQLPPQVQIEITTKDATANTSYQPGVASNFNSGINPASTIPFSFNPHFPVQTNNSMWAFQGTMPPKLIIARYGTPILFREHNKLPADVTKNGVNCFGRHTLTTHEHNGHHGAENDGFTGAYFFPNQFYDYHYPWTLAGWTSINTHATDPRAGAPDGNGGITKVPGDWHETMSSHWFHDHMFTFTDQNVYKGLAGMTNIYSSLDRGNESHNDGVNLRLPSGNLQDYANLQYDINLMFADKAWDSNGQLDMDTAQFDGFLGDQMTVNLCWKPFLQVYARKYRFRLLNASVSRFFVFALSDSSTMTYIANDGNLLPHPVNTTQLDQLGIAERYDIVIDFSRYRAGTKLYLVNLQEQTSGLGAAGLDADGCGVFLPILTVAQAMAGDSVDPAVGPCLQFQVLGPPPTPDMSLIPQTMIPNPAEPAVTNTRTFIFGQGGQITTDDPVTTYAGNGTAGFGVGRQWGIGTYNNTPNFDASISSCSTTSGTLGNGNDDANCTLQADFGRISSAPTSGTAEIWTLINGQQWDHPVHVHFEEGHITQRLDCSGNDVGVPAWEAGRKDVYRLRPGGTVSFFIQFRDWGGMFMEHCHNTMHEDNAMLMRWEINKAGGVFLNPLPTPIPAPTGVTFQAPDEILAGAFPPYDSLTNGSATE
jgi:FtsP/CotA-like multicopper oxidase with cupredoxin domain